MRLATRLSITLTALVCLIVGIHTIWTTGRAMDRIQHDLEEDMRVQGELLAATLTPVVRDDRRTTNQIVSEAAESLPGGAAWWRARAQRPTDFPASEGDWRALIGGGEPFFQQSDSQIAFYAPVIVDGRTRAVVMLQRSPARKQAERDALLFDRLLFAFIMIVAIAVVVRVTVARQVGVPLLALADLSNRIGEGDYTVRVVAGSRGEIGALAEQMNDMAERLEGSRAALETEMNQRLATLQELRHAERLKTVGQLASGTAHELGTPLNVVIGRARMIARGLVKAEALVESAEIIVAQGKRMTELIKGLLRFARSEPSPDGQIDLAEVVERTQTLLTPLLRKRQVRVEAQLPSEPLISRGDPAQIEQILANLLQNAAHAMPDGGTVRVTLTADPGAMVRLTVADEGEGMPPEVAERIFEPFFTTKPVGQGTGLGLSIAYGIVRDHGGRIEVESAPGEGARFHIYLPQIDPPDVRPA
jgi:signal transduction histidine kinase